MPLILLRDVQPERVSWLWPGRIPFGKLTIVDGDGGLGKSTMLLDIAARLSRGEGLPHGPAHEPTGTVLLSVEDGLADTIRPRLDAAGADLSRIAALTGIEDPEQPDTPMLPSIPEDIDHIERAVLMVGARLVVIDPVLSYLSSGTNSHGDQEVRRALTPLVTLAERTGAAIVMVRHLNKTPGAKAIYRGQASIAFIGIVRSGLVVAEDPDDNERRVLAASKSNLAMRPPSLAYRLVDAGGGVAVVRWEGVSSHSADDLLSTPSAEERYELGEAERWLTEALADGGRPAQELVAKARAVGIGERTLRAAKSRLGIGSEKMHAAGGGWYWMPPDGGFEHGKAAGPSQPLQPMQPSMGGEGGSVPLKDAKYAKAAKAGEGGNGVQPSASVAAANGTAIPLAAENGYGDCTRCGQRTMLARGLPALCKECEAASGLRVTAD